MNRDTTDLPANSPAWTDEQLSAFVDGELDPTTAGRLLAQLPQDARLARRVEIFRQTGPQLGELFASELQTPVPEAMRALLRASEPDSRVTPLHRRVRAAATRGQRWPFALAASIIVIIGVSVLLPDLRKQAAQPHAERIAGLPDNLKLLDHTLEHTPSGEPVEVTSAGETFELLPTSTFRDHEGRWCRELRSTQLNTGASAGVLSCRTGEGAWQVAIAAADHYVETVQDEGYFAAGQSTQIDQPYDRLSAAEEQTVMAAGWR